MLMPSIFEDNFVDDFFGFPDRTSGSSQVSLMQTDIQENEEGYTLTMNIPEFKKEDVKAELKDGRLSIHAATSSSDDKKDTNGKYIRRERYYGSCTRSFYVGKDISQEDIKAKFEDGKLILFIPKKTAAPDVEENNYIPIEG